MIIAEAVIGLTLQMVVWFFLVAGDTCTLIKHGTKTLPHSHTTGPKCVPQKAVVPARCLQGLCHQTSLRCSWSRSRNAERIKHFVRSTAVCPRDISFSFSLPSSLPFSHSSHSRTSPLAALVCLAQ